MSSTITIRPISHATHRIGRFAQLLHHLRKDARLRMVDVAALAMIDHSYVSRLESGERVPTRGMVDALSQAMDLLPEERDRLLMAAGFLPESLAGLVDEPELLGLVRRLRLDRGVVGGAR